MNRFNTRILGVVGLVYLMSACATHPTRTSRRGLLEDGATSTVARTTRDPVQANEKASELYAPKEGEKVILSGRWQWPVHHVEISSEGMYGSRGRKFHQGVDLRVPTGTPVYAASDGEVTYVGSKVRGYGKMIVLKHAGGYFSVYAHHSKNLVKFGSHVKRGSLIAYSGRTGHATGPHLHFEIRKGTQSFDPQYAIKNALQSEIARSVASEHRTE